MKTKECKLVFVPNDKKTLERGDYVEYTIYTLHRTVEKFIGQVESKVFKNFIKLGNNEFYNEKEVKPVSPVIYLEKEIIADGTKFALIKDKNRFPNSCAIPVPINTIEVNEILENGGICYIELEEHEDKEELSGNTEVKLVFQNEVPKIINNKIIIVI